MDERFWRGDWAAWQGSEAAGLRAGDFVKLARNGFGDGLNAYAHAMAWFNDALYVGTTRANLCMVHFNDSRIMRVWPTRCPADIDTLDRRAQIWRYKPETERWGRVQVSPVVRGHQGREVARDIGYRGMAVLNGGGRTPSLYVCAWASSRSERTPVILHSDDGERFRAIDTPFTERGQNTYRLLTPFRGRLFTAPTGSTRGWRKGRFLGSTGNLSGASAVVESVRPETGRWLTVSQPGFGDETNATVFEMVEFNDHLYAGTLNPSAGLQIWKTHARGSRPYRWKMVLANGAGRGPLNECATSLCVFKGALYVGTGIQNGGYDRKHKVGPAAAELLRIHPDDSWDLIVGRPRSTGGRVKLPLSGYFSGFDNPFNAYFWRLAVHDGWLYLGTYKWSVLLPFLPLDKWPPGAAAMVRSVGAEEIAQRNGGFDLWRSHDGVRWEPVTRDGFGNRYNYGARTLLSTPLGLVVGTANPFGPEVAVKTRGRWTYQHNPHGGLEVWLGAKGRPVPLRRARAPLLIRAPAGAGCLPDDRELQVHATNRRYDEWMYSHLADGYYHGSDFFNFGYWDRGTRTQVEACANLVARLLDLIPSKRGTILDAACGKGATTRELLQHYGPGQVTGINISAKQLEQCRKNAPGCRFLLMDATDLRFPDESFDNIICVEAAFHFNTRERFLSEALRVLKPGGRLVLSDMLIRQGIEARHAMFTGDNYVANLTEYERLFRRAGFASVTIRDVTGQTWGAHAKHLSRYLRESFRAGRIGWVTFLGDVTCAAWMGMAINNYVLVAAERKVER